MELQVEESKFKRMSSSKKLLKDPSGLIPTMKKQDQSNKKLYSIHIAKHIQDLAQTFKNKDFMTNLKLGSIKEQFSVTNHLYKIKLENKEVTNFGHDSLLRSNAPTVKESRKTNSTN